MVDIGAFAFEFPIRTFHWGLGNIGFDDVRIGRGNGVENGFVDAKILS